MEKAKEGDLYGSFDVYGKSFDIYYGYYEDFERSSKYNDPVPIYPDLAANPEYNSEGYPIVTQMQVVCECYSGRGENDRCGLCRHFEKGEQLFGLCRCESRKNPPQAIKNEKIY